MNVNAKMNTELNLKSVKKLNEYSAKNNLKLIATYLAIFLGALAIWLIIAAFSSPVFFPGPLSVLKGAYQLLVKGILLKDIAVSYLRILGGWVIGSGIGIPLGLLVGRVKLVRTILEPFIQIFRFVPPIAFVTLAIIWFGLGEASKLALIIYTTTFLVILNTATGVASVEKEKIRAAQCLGANPYQIMFRVIIPTTIPYIITGMRLAMGNSFMTVVAAEMIAADSGVGFLIYNSRLFMQTYNIFVGIIVLGLMGLFADFVLKGVVNRFAYRYKPKF